MEVNDSYRELGITRDCSDAEVKAAWRRMAARWHPDRNDSPAALRKIQRINRALEEIRRARRMGEEAGTTQQGAAAAPAEAPAGDREPPHASGFTRTLHHTVSLTLEQACEGCVMNIEGQVIGDCAACGATGVDPKPAGCLTCGGSGQVRQPLWFGWLSAPAECTDCQARGELPQACASCDGSGKSAPRSYRVRVRIPPGLRDGGQLQVPARARSRGGSGSETLAITVAILPHDFFTLDEDGTVRCEVPVDGFAWMAEHWTDVPTPSGLQQMRLRRGHLVYRIKAQGFPAPGGRTRADCLVTIAPLFPATLAPDQEALVQRLIASNTRQRVTPAGEKVAAWEQALARWQQGLSAADPRRSNA